MRNGEVQCTSYRVFSVDRLGYESLKPEQETMGRTKFTTSGAHDVIAITSLPKNYLCTEELRNIDKSLDELGQSNT